MKNLRTDVENLPIESSRVTLMRLRGRETLYDATITGKRELVATRKPSDRFVAAWTGEWRTGIFEVPKDLLDALRS